MIRFNSLLAAASIDPDRTRLVRHKHQTKQRQVFHDALYKHPNFDFYQSVQSNARVIDQICSAEQIASFVVDPSGRTLFVGVWDVYGVVDQPPSDPYDDPPLTDRPRVVLDLRRSSALDSYSGRVVVDWGSAERAWVQYADRQNKEVVELRQRAQEPSFPGFAQFECALHEVEALPEPWRATLRATRGIYLLIHRESGAQYVGSAIGTDGLLGRWRIYADGHGGNVGMKELAHPANQFEVRILETVGSGATVEEIYEIESMWKRKLGSRAKGLNRN